ncbi:MAG TPA: acylneuraminate cytidylyltransferase family protein [bacterium]|nr:acylneuraminate cytidylyltransferase family protein [bacterium]
MKTLGIIPARGGSKGLPRKNVRDLGGKPLIVHTIEAAKESRIDRVILTTDDDEIAEIGRKWGAEVPFKRPPEFATDTVASLLVLLHALHFMEEHEGFSPDTVVYLQPTSPFRTAKHIDEALDLFQSSGATSVMGMTEVYEHPYYMFELKEDKKIRPFMYIQDRPLRRQEVPYYYRINGALYISKREYYRNISPVAPVCDFDNCVAYVMDSASSVDINDYLDFKKAEMLLQEKHGKDK